MAEADSRSAQGLRPLSIRHLCEAQGRVYPLIAIFCYYCQRKLSTLDIRAFDQSRLSILWREGNPNAVCSMCIRLLARLDFTSRHQFSCSIAEAEQYIGKVLEEAEVRCIRCLAKLIPLEIRLLKRGNLVVHKVADTWRAPCARCSMGFF